MSRDVSRDQALQISSRVATQVKWEELDGDGLREVTNLSPEEFGKRFTIFLKNGARFQVFGKHTIDCDKDPVIPSGWFVVEHKRDGQVVWDQSKVSLYLSKEQRGGKIQGNKLHEELKDKPVLNANVLDYLLEHQEIIPEEWKKKSIYFWGTIFRLSLNGPGGFYVRFLSWDGLAWRDRCHWLDCLWNESEPALLICA